MGTTGLSNNTAELRRRAYLKALEIDVYALRGNDAAADDERYADEAAETPAPASARIDVADLNLDGLRDKVSSCTQCMLHKSRTQTVFGVGNPKADWMIVGEAPGAEEDRRGEPFVGRAGQLLDEMLHAVGLSREAVYIANTLKCRPPNNRDPAAEESAACRGYLERQIELIGPKLIVAVGRVAAQLLLETDAPLGRLRQQKHHLSDRQIPVIVTYHPAYLLRSPTQKRKAWLDLVLAKNIIANIET